MRKTEGVVKYNCSDKECNDFDYMDGLRLLEGELDIVSSEHIKDCEVNSSTSVHFEHEMKLGNFNKEDMVLIEKTLLKGAMFLFEETIKSRDSMSEDDYNTNIKDYERLLYLVNVLRGKLVYND